eukprot:Phypoly_transcript_02622.p1 GENE.Phypoly_transcript_02622~~Phypoly_transcript_02622.p1  ORF type:complete len:855 (+),score=165.96 Phypoly_transcript_02622:154-2718(+)
MASEGDGIQPTVALANGLQHSSDAPTKGSNSARKGEGGGGETGGDKTKEGAPHGVNGLHKSSPRAGAVIKGAGGTEGDIQKSSTLADTGSGRDEDAKNAKHAPRRSTTSQGTSTPHGGVAYVASPHGPSPLSQGPSTPHPSHGPSPRMSHGPSPLSQGSSTPSPPPQVPAYGPSSQGTPFLQTLTSQGKWQSATSETELFVGAQGPTPVLVDSTPRTGRPHTSKWISQGSEEEIKSFGPGRDLIKLSISRKRKEFGAPNKFSDRDAHDGLVECRPFKNPNYDLMMKEVEVGIQGVPQMASTHTQTTWFRKVNATTQYEAMELNLAQRTLVQRAPELTSFLVRAMDDCLNLALQQNEAIDLFRQDFPEQAEEEAVLFGGKADNILREIQSFTDLRHSKDKMLGSAGWLPNARGVVAVACLENANFDERVAQSGKVRSSLILIWNFVDPIHPQALLEAPSDVTVLKFHPSASILVAGCANGQILYYDLSVSLNGHTSTSQTSKKTVDPSAQKANIPIIPCTVMSSIEASHRTSVMDIIWLQNAQEFNKGRTTNLLDQSTNTLAKATSTTGGVARGTNLVKVTSSMGGVLKGTGGGSSSQFITIAPDGQMLIWDIRFKKEIKEMDMFWVPMHRMALTRLDAREELTLCAISLAPTSTKFACATEDGELVLSDRAPLMEGTRVQPQITPCHHGPVKSLERSPFFDDILLTVGDWTVSVWKEGGATPLLTSPHCASEITVGQWSPTRPGVFYVGRADGFMDVWDLMDKAHIPTMSQQVAPCALASMQFPPADMPPTLKQTNQVVVGDSAGTLHLLEVPKNLVRQAPNERGLVDVFLKREQARIESSANWSRERTEDSNL